MFAALQNVCRVVSKELGTGHSEAMYQKACSLLLQKIGVSHQLEYHLPVVVQSGQHMLNVGDERIDILLFDNDDNIYIVELKAIAARICPAQPKPNMALHSSHIQLLKYVNMLQKDDNVRASLKEGYVINFRQHVTLDNMHAMEIEFNHYNVNTRQWSFSMVKEDTHMPRSLHVSAETGDSHNSIQRRNVI